VKLHITLLVESYMDLVTLDNALRSSQTSMQRYVPDDGSPQPHDCIWAASFSKYIPFGAQVRQTPGLAGRWRRSASPLLWDVTFCAIPKAPAHTTSPTRMLSIQGTQ
jgi:hypothetical protein